MGIDNFRKWVFSAFPEAISSVTARDKTNFDHVAFDMNQILHQEARKASSRAILVKLIFREMSRILVNCNPKKSIFIAFDGPGPLAKLLLQRRRRSTRAQEKKKQTGRKRFKPAKEPIDRLGLTPGAELLYYLHDAVKYWAVRCLQQKKYPNVNIIISGPDVPGEGELKIIDYCKSHNVDSSESVIVIGGDADIVVQGIATVELRNFFVYLRHTGRTKKKSQVSTIVSVWEICRTFEKVFPGELNGVRLDFVVLTAMSGNDYVPKLRGSVLENSWRRYVKLKTGRGYRPLNGHAPFKGQFLIDAKNRTFNWAFLYALIDKYGKPWNKFDLSRSSLREAQASIDFVKSRSKLEQRSDDGPSADENLNNEVVLYDGNEDGVYPESSDDDMADVEYEDNQDCEVDNMADVLEESGLNCDDDNTADDLYVPNDEYEDSEDSHISEEVDEDEAHINTLAELSDPQTRPYNIERWLRAILWTLQCYIDGYCSDYSFAYGKPYAPSRYVICDFIQDHGGDPFDLNAPVSNVPPLLPHLAALAMLPKQGASLLPAPLRTIVEDPDICKDVFLSEDRVDVGLLVAAAEKIPLSHYTEEELKRTKFGMPYILRLKDVRNRKANISEKVGVLSLPGTNFEPLKPTPLVTIAPFSMTSQPPCKAWPTGGVNGMLDLPYIRVTGSVQNPKIKKSKRSKKFKAGAKVAQKDNNGQAKESMDAANQNGVNTQKSPSRHPQPYGRYRSQGEPKGQQPGNAERKSDVTVNRGVHCKTEENVDKGSIEPNGASASSPTRRFQQKCENSLSESNSEYKSASDSKQGPERKVASQAANGTDKKTKNMANDPGKSISRVNSGGSSTGKPDTEMKNSIKAKKRQLSTMNQNSIEKKKANCGDKAHDKQRDSTKSKVSVSAIEG